MNIKRSLLVTTLLAGCHIAFANAPLSSNTTNIPPTNYFYIQAQISYAMRDWQGFKNFNDLYNKSSFTNTNPRFTHGTGGIAWGINLGYQFTQTLSTDVFYTNLSNTQWNDTDTTHRLSGEIDTWIVGATLRISNNLLDGLLGYIEGGAAFVNDSSDYKTINTADASTINYHVNDNHITVIIGAGVKYNIASTVYVGAQYSYVTGNSSTPNSNNDFRSPAINLFTVSVGYRFS